MELADQGGELEAMAMDELGAAARAVLTALVGETGVAEDRTILIAQMERALSILNVPAMATESLFEAEPSSHAATLLRLAPDDAR